MRLAFLGCGNMGEAIVRGLLAKGVVAPQDVVLTDKTADRRAMLERLFPVRVTDSNAEAIAAADVVVLAVKPQGVLDVCADIAPATLPGHLFVSICAGMKTHRIEEQLTHAANAAPRVVRVMPNTPALVGEGVAGICPGAHATAEDTALALRLFDAVGTTFLTNEEKMDAVTALTGSGPAYVFRFMEAMISGAERHGFHGAEAQRMILQMVYGAAKLARDSDLTPADLRRAVTSPGGTTEAGLEVLDARGFEDIIISCIDRAERRGHKLGKAEPHHDDD